MENNSKKTFLWSLPQPVYVIGAAALAASAAATGWMDSGLLVTLLVYLPIPLLLLFERLVPKRQDWLLSWKDLAEDSFWVLTNVYIWVPIYDDNYDTPISTLFASVRDSSGFPFKLEAGTTLGILFLAIIGLLASEFIGYWAHRVQHRFMFFWRIHATHHHLTKMSVARAQRGHPLENLGLNLGFAVAFAFLGASDAVIGVAAVIGASTGFISHGNVPLRPGWFGWLFNTPTWHQLHHSNNYGESNTNYGCVLIIWDRVFGTFSGKESIERVGNGTGRHLSLWTKYTLPFRSNKFIRGL